jgi:hypothetical protein
VSKNDGNGTAKGEEAAVVKLVMSNAEKMKMSLNDDEKVKGLSQLYTRERW